jgi:fermentation-respiration switch protein FrsA (DUF1100 family)
MAARLANAGLAAISFNFSGSGVGPDGETFSEPERFARDTYLRQLTDLEVVCHAAATGTLVPGFAPPRKLGLLGHSRGGGVAVLRASQDLGVGALVTWAGIATVYRWPPETLRRWRAEGKLDVVNTRTGQVLPLGTDILDEMDRHSAGRLDILAAAARVRAPWLILHGEADEAVPVEQASDLHQATGRKATLRLVPGGGHTFGARHPWQGSTPELDQVMDGTVEWFGRYLL